jgi:hypothetical protein
VDARDTDAPRRATITASPRVVIDQLTDLAQPLRPGGFDKWLKGTIALRRDVTPTLVNAVREAGVLRVIAQSDASMTARISVERAERQVGRQAVYYGTQLRGASNGKARRDLGFSPVYPDWRDGFGASLAPAT